MAQKNILSFQVFVHMLIYNIECIGFQTVAWICDLEYMYDG